MVGNLIVVEHVKLLKRQLTWVVLGLLTALVFVQVLAQYLIAKNPPSANGVEIPPEAIEKAVSSVLWPTALPAILSGAGQLAWLVVIVLFGAVIAQEYNWRTLHMWLARGVPRGQLIVAKATTFFLPCLGIVILPAVVVGALTAALTVISKGGLDVSQIDPLGLALGIGVTAWSILPYAAVTLPLAVASRSTIAPIGGGVAFVILEQVLVLMKAPVAPYMPSALGASLGALRALVVRGAHVPQVAAAQSGISVLDPASAAIGVAIWVLACVAAAYLILRRQDVAE